MTESVKLNHIKLLILTGFDQQKQPFLMIYLNIHLF